MNLKFSPLPFPFIAAASALVLASSPIHGQATIATPGADGDNFNAWRSTSVDKPFNTDATEAYGTAGYILYYTRADTYSGSFVSTFSNPLTASGTLTSIPGFLTVANASMDYAGLSSTYANVDNPTLAIDTTVANIKPGLAGDDGQRSDNFFTFTVGSGFPQYGLRVGIAARNAGNDALNTIRITQTNGGSAMGEYTSTIAGSSIYTIYFFDIVGAQAGDVFTVFGAKPNVGNNNVLHAGVTFDVIPIPEPATAALTLGTLAAGLLTLRRRRA